MKDEKQVHWFRFSGETIGVSEFEKIFHFDPSFRDDIRINADVPLCSFTVTSTSKERLNDFCGKVKLCKDKTLEQFKEALIQLEKNKEETKEFNAWMESKLGVEHANLWKLSPPSPEKPEDFKGDWRLPKKILHYFRQNGVYKLAWSDSIAGNAYVVFQTFTTDILGHVESWEQIPWEKIDTKTWTALQASMTGVCSEYGGIRNKINAKRRAKLIDEGLLDNS